MKARYVNGYRLIYKPNHLTAMKSKNWLGYVYEHIYVAEKMMCRALLDDEVVHHLDGSRDNNNAANLLVLQKGQHHKLHIWLHSVMPDKFAPVGSGLGIYDNSPNKHCVICGLTLQNKQIHTCSLICNKEYIKKTSKVKNKPSKDELIDLIVNNTMESIGEMYGVSSNAVRRWCVNNEIDYKALLKSKCFTPTTKPCLYCNFPMEINIPSDNKRKYCSYKCSGLGSYDNNKII